MTTTSQNHLITAIKTGRRVSTPIFAVTTPDQSAVELLIREAVNGDACKFSWDLVRGIRPRNAEADEWLAHNDLGATEDPIAMLMACERMPAKSLIFVHSANRFLADTAVMQAILNLRDEFKTNRRSLILLGPAMELPPELIGSVVEVDDPLPTKDELADIVRAQLANTPAEQLKFEPTDEIVNEAAEHLLGTMAYSAEQCAAMSIRRSGLDNEYLNLAARKLIEQTKGLHFERGPETFADIGGLDFAKEFGHRLADGPERPTVVVRVEELEKAMAGSTGGDLSGTSSDALQVLLSEMQDNDWTGILAYGAPGAGKSLFAKAMANSINAKALRFDINACKGSLVGQSEQAIRAVMKTLRTIGGTRVFFVASVNRLNSLPPELQRRFRCGVWFFDTPGKTDRAKIWAINRTRFDVSDDDPGFDEDDLTGADIFNVCETAYRLNCSLEEARDYVVPLKTQSPDAIEDARKMARHRFIDANRGGIYGRSAADWAKGSKQKSRQVDVAE